MDFQVNETDMRYYDSSSTLEDMVEEEHTNYVDRDWTGEYFGVQNVRFAVYEPRIPGNVLGTCDGEGNIILYGRASVHHSNNINSTFVHENQHRNDTKGNEYQWSQEVRDKKEQRAYSTFLGPP